MSKPKSTRKNERCYRFGIVKRMYQTLPNHTRTQFYFCWPAPSETPQRYPWPATASRRWRRVGALFFVGRWNLGLEKDHLTSAAAIFMIDESIGCWYVLYLTMIVSVCDECLWSFPFTMMENIEPPNGFTRIVFDDWTFRNECRLQSTDWCFATIHSPVPQLGYPDLVRSWNFHCRSQPPAKHAAKITSQATW